MATGPRDDNRVPSLIAKSDADNTPIVVEADPATKRLKVTTTISGSPTVATGFFTLPYDEILVTYTDSGKGTISTARSKLAGITQQTITLTQGSTTDDYVRT